MDYNLELRKNKTKNQACKIYLILRGKGRLNKERSKFTS
jgi:hypothetical protein